MKTNVFVIGTGAVGFVSGLVLLATGSIFLGGFMIAGAGALVVLGVNEI